MHSFLSRLASRCGLRVCAAGLIATLALSTTAHAGIIWAVDNQDNLFDFDNTTPNNIITGHTISGLAANEQILQIDFDPGPAGPGLNGGKLYGLSNQNRLYTLDDTTGAATQVGAGTFTPVMNGNHFGFDVSPLADSGRMVSDADQNLQLNMTSGAATGNLSLSYATGDINQGKNPSVVALGYSNSLPTSNSTTLYGIDTNLNTLVKFSSETGGTLQTVGSLGIDATGLTGMDIATNPPTGPNAGDVAFANIELPGSSVSDLYSINLTTGLATDQGRIIDGVQVRDIAAELGQTFIVPEPASAMLLLAIGGMLTSRRRIVR